MKRILFIASLVIIGVTLAAYCRKIINLDDAKDNEKVYPMAMANSGFTASNAWYAFAHDAQRTSASTDGTITSLAEQWAVKAGTSSYHGGAGYTIGDDVNLWYGFSDWSSTNNGTGDYYALNKYNVSGSLLWSNKRLGANHCNHFSPARIGNYIFVSDDELQRIDDNGSVRNVAGFDIFGEICPYSDNTQYFVANTSTNEGFGYNLSLNSFATEQFIPVGGSNYTWRQWIKLNADINGDDINRGSICYDGGRVFYAPKYSTVTTYTYGNGVYAIDPSDGSQIWYQSSIPAGRMSAGNSLLYLVEGTNLIARNQSDGTVAWTQAITGSLCAGQPPVVAGSLVIIATSVGVYAFNGTTGTPAWNTAIAGIYSSWSRTVSECTVMAAALGSNTLVVTADAGVYILDLTDGSNDVFYDPPSIVNRPVNPIIVGSRVYVSDGNTGSTPSNELNYSQFRMVCLQSGVTPPPPDTDPPTQPGTPSFSNVTTSSMDAAWTASTDNVAVSYYNVYYKQSTQSNYAVIQSTAPTITLNGLLASTTYNVYVTAVDGSNNVSTASAVGSQATADETSNPTTTLYGSVGVGTNGIRNVHYLNWTYVDATQELQRKYKNTAYVTIYTGNPPYQYVQPSTNTSYTYRVRLNGTYFSNEVTLKSSRR